MVNILSLLLSATIFISVFLLPAVTQEKKEQFVWDENGYVFFCLCMGRFGNQAEHFLGGLSFTKKINRTLVLPPFRTYKNNEFSEWFKVEPIKEYHRVILASDFMSEFASEHWPPGKRIGFCYGSPGSECKMKEGNPFGPFWDELGIDFDEKVLHMESYKNPEGWQERFPPDKYPVLAFKGAPASFPMAEEDVPLHRYLQWSDKIEDEVNHHLQKLFGGEKFIGIHLRNGIDWVNVCKHAPGTNKYMSSQQCLGYRGDKTISSKMCLPPVEEVLRLTKNTVVKTRVKNIYVATDKNPMVEDLENHLKSLKVKVHHLDPWLPQIDLAILGKSEHFIGNCISSFTSFVARERLVNNKPTSYWGYS